MPESRSDTARKMQLIQDNLDRWSQRFGNADVLRAALNTPHKTASLLDMVRDFMLLEDECLPVGLSVGGMSESLAESLLSAFSSGRIFHELFSQPFFFCEGSFRCQLSEVLRAGRNGKFILAIHQVPTNNGQSMR